MISTPIEIPVTIARLALEQYTLCFRKCLKSPTFEKALYICREMKLHAGICLYAYKVLHEKVDIPDQVYDMPMETTSRYDLLLTLQVRIEFLKRQIKNHAQNDTK